MLKKGLIRTCIWEYLGKLDKVVDEGVLLGELPNIYKHLKKHPWHGDLLPKYTYNEFIQQVQIGRQKARVGQMFNFKWG